MLDGSYRASVVPAIRRSALGLRLIRLHRGQKPLIARADLRGSGIALLPRLCKQLVNLLRRLLTAFASGADDLQSIVLSYCC